MRIKRKYELLGILYENDQPSREAIDSAFDLCNVSEERRKQLLEWNGAFIPAFFNIGCMIPGECYKAFMDRFEELDASIPYDNGLSFKDVHSVEFETSRKGTAIQLRLVNQVMDMPYRIVGFVAIENVNDRLRINKGWEMARPYEIG